MTTAGSNADPNNGGATAVFKPFTTSLASYAGQNVQIRWRFSSDPAANFLGFLLDGVHISGATTDQIFADGFDGGPMIDLGTGTDGGNYMCN